jgi:hypothetical protein
VLLAQAEMILRSSEESVPEEADRADVRRSHDAVTLIALTASSVPSSVEPYHPGAPYDPGARGVGHDPDGTGHEDA